MKKLSNTILRSVAAAVLLASSLLVGRANAIPGANTVYLTPSSSSVQNGDTVAVSIWVNAATAAAGGYDGIDGIDTTVNFSSSQFQYVSVDATGSAFGPLLQTNSSSNVRIARALAIGEPYVTGNVFVAKVNLKAVAGSGSAGVTLSATNTTHGAAYTGPALQNTSVTLTTAAATCPAGQTGTPPNCTTPPSGGGGSTGGGSSGGTKPLTSTGSTPKPNTVTSTTPAASDPIQASVGDPVVEYTIASLTLTTQVPTQSYIQFGLTKDGLSQQTAADDFATSHTLSIDSSLLSPGETYFYTVVSKDQSGNVTQTAVRSFTTKGLTVTVVVFDKNHKSLAKKKMTLHSSPQTVKTDGNGVATFTNVKPGDHEAIYEAGGKSYSQAITVPNNVKLVGGKQTSAVQNFSVIYSGYEQRALPGLMWVVVLVIVVLAALGYLGLRSRKQPIPMTSLLSTSPVTVSTSAPQNHTGNPIDSVTGLDKPSPGSTVSPNSHDSLGSHDSDDKSRPGGV
jgi:hypothetical protein